MAGKHLRLLIVEDSEDDAVLLLKHLERAGYESESQRVDTAEDLAEALEKQTWDVVISDEVLPRFSGAKALAMVKEKGLDAPFILVSGKIDEDSAVAHLKAGAHDFVNKNNLARLVPAIERELAEAETRRKKKESERQLAKVTRALRVRSECDRLLVRARDEQELARGICGVVVESGGYRLAWVGYAEQDANKTVRPIASAGYEDGYLDNISVTWADTDLGRGPTGTAIRTRIPRVARDILVDPQFEAWRHEALSRGYASSAALPLVAGGQTIGALNIYAGEPDAFDVEELRLLSELADDAAYGIAALRSRVELRELESAFTTMADKAPVALAIAVDARFVFVNEALCQLLGYSPEELLSIRPKDVIHADDRKEFIERTVQALRVKASSAHECRAVTKGGNVRWVLGSVNTIQFRGQKATLGSFLDITERKASEERLSSLHQVSLAVSQSLDLSGVASTALAAVLKTLGMDAGVVWYLDESTRELVPLAHSGLPEELAQEVQTRPRMKVGVGLAGKVAKSGSPLVIESIDDTHPAFYHQGTNRAGFRGFAGVPLKVKDKVVGVIAGFSLEQRVFTPADLQMLTAVGNMVGMAMGNAHLFEQVQAKAREWEQTFDAMSDGVAIIGSDYTVLRANGSLALKVGAASKLLVGRPCFEVVHGVAAPFPDCPLPRCLADNRQHALVRQEPHLGNRWLNMLVDPMSNGGKTRMVVEVFTDITDMKEAEAEILRRNEELTEHNRHERDLRLQLEATNSALEHRVQELTALNTLFQKNLDIRFRAEETLKLALNELDRFVKEGEQLLDRARTIISSRDSGDAGVP